jgi:glycerol-1-phosphate dehydrogenase [NAD(P)+]
LDLNAGHPHTSSIQPAGHLFDHEKTKPPALAIALECARETRSPEIGHGQIACVPEVFNRGFPGRSAVVVADVKTFAAAGRDIRCRNQSYFGSPTFTRSSALSSFLESALRPHAAIPVAVGSGSINDVTKLAAHRASRP